jgi:hypothetical protein
MTRRPISLRFLTPALLIVVLIFAGGCKSKKKAMEAAAADKARTEQEAALKKQQEDDAKRRLAEEQARREAEERENASKAAAPAEAKLTEYFTAITTAGSIASANSSITEALSLFANENTPVLIVISESGGIKDYDRPTTIRDYLNYLKDQKKNLNRIGDLQFDASGKITEVELIRNK